jgi:hypothetical protein
MNVFRLRRSAVHPLPLHGILTILVLLALVPTVPAADTWQDLGGPGQGYTYALVRDDARDILYRSASTRGIWRLQGGVWSDLGFPGGGVAVSLAFDASRNVLYAGSPGNGVWRCDSPDGVPLWTAIGFQGQDAVSFYALALDESRDLLYAGFGYGASGIERCQGPSGTTPVWTHFEVAVESMPPRVLSLAFDAARSILYAGTANHTVWRGTGTEGDDPYFVWMSGAYTTRTLVHDPVRNVLYAGTQGDGVLRYPAPDISTDWVRMGGEIDRLGIGSLALDTAGNRLYAGSAFSRRGVWRADDPDSSPLWNDIGGPLDAANVPAMVYDPLGDALYAAEDSSFPGAGVWKCTTPGGVPAWVDTGGGLSTAWITGMAYHAASDTLFAANGNSPPWAAAGASDASPVWTNLGSPDKTSQNNFAIVHDPARDILYAGYNFFGIWRRSAPGSPAGEWVNISGSLGAADIRALAYDPGRNVLYAFRSDGRQRGIWRSKNPDSGAPSWSKVGKAFPNAVASLVLDTRRNILYAGEESPEDLQAARPAVAPRVWRCARPNTQGIWTPVGKSFGGVGHLALDVQRNVLYAAGRGIWRCNRPSGAAGSWSPMGGSLKRHWITALALDPKSNELFAAGEKYPASSGLMACAKPNLKSVWTAVGGPARKQYISSLLHDPTGRQLFVGIGGRGAYRYRRD